MRKTKQKTAILEHVCSTKNHPTADWIFKQVRKKIPNISLGTVYRNLNQLVADGSIGTYQFDRTVCYDGTVDHHDHFRCSKCGTISDVEVLEKDFIKNIYQTQALHVTNVKLDLIGLCKACLC
jgi:Fur family peroxide stress response transcriptional regulator